MINFLAFVLGFGTIAFLLLVSWFILQIPKAITWLFKERLDVIGAILILLILIAVVAVVGGSHDFGTLLLRLIK